MAPLKVKKIVSFSSEDPLHPASNLLDKGKWKCREEGEKQAWVLLQLEETSNITNIDIGNDGAAFIEVQVGRLGTDTDQMKVLLVASSFMSVNEARVGENMGRVRMFGQDKLAQEVAKEKWDLVKVVVTQPFTKRFRYGISFITLSGPSGQGLYTPAKPTLGAFKLKLESDQDITVGSYFARQQAGGSPATPQAGPSVAAALRADTTVGDLALQKARRQETKRKREVELTPAMKAEAKKRKVERVLPSRNSLPGESSDTEETNGHNSLFKEANKARVKRDTDKDNNEKIVATDRNDETKKQTIKKEKPVAAAQTKQSKPHKFAAFSDLMKGVVFTISGFQNPLRGEIRKKALEMGAKYCGDWNSSCTHLVCAFANTPKFNQVVGKGIIVKKDWVEECYRQRKRLPWRRYCLDRRDEGKDESEEEVWEKDSTTENGDYECDTDEEIEKIKTEEEKEKKQKRNAIATASEMIDSYECDTDEEIEKIKNEERLEKQKMEKQKLEEQKLEKQKLEKQKLENLKLEKQKLEKNTYDCDTDSENDEYSTIDNDIDPYDVETDIDEEEIVKLLPNTSKLGYGSLPNYFDCQEFYFHGDFQSGERQVLERYILACGGKVKAYMGEEVNVVITNSRWDKKFEEARAVSKEVEFVRPEWVFRCQDEGRVVEFGHFQVRVGK
eukprot:GFUD01057503.1.p1 GENE.GFUD01057503.1~~GFUD01057503.1.p1  ORF type:complete len:671 (+),score=267.75 GFUD01057503.1:61-2073(+)